LALRLWHWQCWCTDDAAQETLQQSTDLTRPAVSAGAFIVSFEQRALILEQPMSNDLEDLQGIWKQIAYERDGIKEPLDEQGWEPQTTFTGNSFVVTRADGSVPIEGTFRIDPTSQPKAMDLTDTFGADAGKTFLAIYSRSRGKSFACTDA
jgi:uncharacterized protein (TIGR03067 family)